VIALALVTSPVAASPRFGEWSPPVNLGPIVNSSAIEFGPAISPNGLSLYISVFSPSKGDEDIFVSHREKRSDPWGVPVSLTPINTSANERVPAFSHDGRTMFFASDRAGGFGSTDVWMSHRDNPRDDFSWSQPVNLGPGVNTAAGESGSTLFERADASEDEDANESGAVLIFNTDRRGSQDFYMSVRRADGTFAAATEIKELNTPFTDARPTIRSDGLEIFFFSNRTGSRQLDLWTATRSSPSDPWSAPVNLGLVVNSASSDIQPYLSRDARTLFFGSNRPGSNNGDIWMTTRVRVGELDDD
jgi:Tol biopolymer transport system component